MRSAAQPEDIEQRIESLAAFGQSEDGGVTRFAYTEAWLQAAIVVEAWMADVGLETRMDTVGNVFGRLPGVSGRTILTGSHIDSVENGGRYDGTLGICVGIEALGCIRKSLGNPHHNIEVVAFCEEESSRFPRGFIGSRAITGELDGCKVHEEKDWKGVRLSEAMRSVGLDPKLVSGAHRADIESFIEVHIEQGPVLHYSGIDIGIVTGIVGLLWMVVEVVGRADHAGATPMHARCDAMQAAADLSLAITAMVEEADNLGVVTMGSWDVKPGGPNIVPEFVRFSIDLRHPEQSRLKELGRRVQTLCESAQERRGVNIDLTIVRDSPCASMDKALSRQIEESAVDLGLSFRHMPSGAGHDSQVMAAAVPTAMIFVPSVNGRSHSPAEYTTAESAAKGADVLALTLQRLGYVDA